MSALVAVVACLCALSVFVATGLDRADARKIAGACKREAVLVLSLIHISEPTRRS